MSDIAINPVTRRVQFTGNTGTGPYAFTFNVLQSSDIVVYKNNAELTLTSDYSVSISANGTGSITLVSALAASDVLTIVGGRELSRTTDFVTAGDLLASSLNEQLDSNVIMVQQLDEKIDRSIRQDPSDENGNMILPNRSDRINKFLKFDATGNPSVQSDLEISGTILGSNYIVDDFTGDGATTVYTLSNEPGVKTNMQVYIDGVYQNKSTYSISEDDLTFSEAPPDGSNIEVVSGKALFTGESSSSIQFNQPGSAAKVRTVQDKLRESISVKDFGAKGDATTDDRAAIQACIDYVEGFGENQRPTIVFPSGRYRIGSSYPSTNLPQGTFGQYSNFENKTIGLVIPTTGNIRMIGHGKVTIEDDRTGPDATIAFVGTGGVRDFHMENFLILAKSNTVKTDAPKYNIISYSDFINQSKFINIEMQGSQTANMSLHVWGTRFEKCKASYGHTDGFVFTSQNYAGTYRGLTSINMIDCYARTIHRWGFDFEGQNYAGFGSQGHNFSAMRTCYADFIGYDPATSAQSTTYLSSTAAVRISNARTMLIENFGGEDVVRALVVRYTQTLHVDGFQVQNIGFYSDLSENVGSYISFNDENKNCVLEGWTTGGSLGTKNNILNFALTGNSGDERLTIPDNCIRPSDINLTSDTGGATTTTLASQEDHYEKGDVLVGNLLRRETAASPSIATSVRRESRTDNAYTKQYKLNTGASSSGTQNLISLLNAERTKDGMVSVMLRITAVSQASAPSAHILTASIGSTAEYVDTSNQISNAGLSTALSLSWDSSSGTDYKLVLTYGNATNQMFFVEMLVSAHEDTETPFFTLL